MRLISRSHFLSIPIDFTFSKNPCRFFLLESSSFFSAFSFPSSSGFSPFLYIQSVLFSFPDFYYPIPLEFFVGLFVLLPDLDFDSLPSTLFLVFIMTMFPKVNFLRGLLFIPFLYPWSPYAFSTEILSIRVHSVFTEVFYSRYRRLFHFPPGFFLFFLSHLRIPRWVFSQGNPFSFSLCSLLPFTNPPVLHFLFLLFFSFFFSGFSLLLHIQTRVFSLSLPFSPPQSSWDRHSWDFSSFFLSFFLFFHFYLVCSSSHLCISNRLILSSDKLYGIFSFFFFTFMNTIARVPLSTHMTHEFYQKCMMDIFPRTRFFLSMGKTFFLLVYSNPTFVLRDPICKCFSSSHMHSVIQPQWICSPKIIPVALLPITRNSFGQSNENHSFPYKKRWGSW